MAVTASGLFATTDLVGNSYTITGAWGTWNGAAITGLLAPGAFGGNDNLLFTSGPLIDSNGLAFVVNAGGDDGSGSVNVFYDSGQGGYTENSSNVGVGPDFSTSTPSPAAFNFAYSIPGSPATPMAVSASGILTAFNITANSYLVRGISGTWNGAAILDLLSPQAFGGNDNLLFTADPHLTGNGLGFTVNDLGDDGSGNVNVFFLGSYTENSVDVGGTPTFSLSRNVQTSATPEPASVVLLCVGIPVFLLVRRRSNAHACTKN
jgi:hypothetical protein